MDTKRDDFLNEKRLDELKEEKL